MALFFNGREFSFIINTTERRTDFPAGPIHATRALSLISFEVLQLLKHPDPKVGRFEFDLFVINPEIDSQERRLDDKGIISCSFQFSSPISS
jgi:hypothetical protein